MVDGGLTLRGGGEGGVGLSLWPLLTTTTLVGGGGEGEELKGDEEGREGGGHGGATRKHIQITVGAVFKFESVPPTGGSYDVERKNACVGGS